MKIFFLLALLTCACTIKALESTIASYHTMNTLHEQMVYELEKFEDQWNITRGDNLGVSSASSSWWFKGQTIELNNIRISSGSLNAKKLNVTSVWETNDTFVLKMEGSLAFALQLSFDYEYSCFSGGKGSGEVFIEAFDTVLSKIYNTSIGDINVTLEAKFTDVPLLRLSSGPYAGDLAVEIHPVFHRFSPAREARRRESASRTSRNSQRRSLFSLCISRSFSSR